MKNFKLLLPKLLAKVRSLEVTRSLFKFILKLTNDIECIRCKNVVFLNFERFERNFNIIIIVALNSIFDHFSYNHVIVRVP